MRIAGDVTETVERQDQLDSVISRFTTALKQGARQVGENYTVQLMFDIQEIQ